MIEGLGKIRLRELAQRHPQRGVAEYMLPLPADVVVQRHQAIRRLAQHRDAVDGRRHALLGAERHVPLQDADPRPVPRRVVEGVRGVDGADRVTRVIAPHAAPQRDAGGLRQVDEEESARPGHGAPPS
jgi:hypothetical protein